MGWIRVVLFIVFIIQIMKGGSVQLFAHCNIIIFSYLNKDFFDFYEQEALEAYFLFETCKYWIGRAKSSYEWFTTF
jgi:hypothetical protein